jgi:[ribosomal protein S5]-alanine N-acetyltransferase
MDMLTVDTDRLRLIACPAQIARAVVRGRRHAEALLGVCIHHNWPSQEIRVFMPIYAQQVERDPDHVAWGIWLVLHTANRTVIGDVGFKGKPNMSSTVDIGYGIVPEYRRQGYAYEAARGLRDWAFSQPGVSRITGDCLPENLPSARILEKLGMRRIGHSTAGLLLWEIKRADTRPAGAGE